MDKIKRNKRKKRNRLIPILCAVLGGLIIICIGMLVVDRNVKDKPVAEKKQEQKEQNVDEIASYEIDTDYCKLYFPESWKDQIEVKYTDEAGYKAEFYGLAEGKEETHLFDVCFNSDDGYLLGCLKNDDEIINISIDMKEVEFDDTWTQEEIDQVIELL